MKIEDKDGKPDSDSGRDQLLSKKKELPRLPPKFNRINRREAKKKKNEDGNEDKPIKRLSVLRRRSNIPTLEEELFFKA
jgi:hypothetical protein